MNVSKRITALFFITLLAVGCASTPTRESTGQYFDDSVITAKVKAAVFNESTLKSSEINVETFKGVVQLSGFVSSQTDINKAVQVAEGVGGVKSVKNAMTVKGQK
jgi:osmotically-inducible protein OsmY